MFYQLATSTWHCFCGACRKKRKQQTHSCQAVAIQVSQLHWLSAPWQINFKLAVLAFKCLHGLAPSYLADELHPAETEFRQRLRSASSPALSVPRTRLSTNGEQAF